MNQLISRRIDCSRRPAAFVSALIVFLAAMAWAASLAAQTGTGLVQSIKSPGAGSISGMPLSDSDLEQDMRFTVSLRMRNFPELQARVARGERISRDEMSARYYPTPASYDSVVDWVRGEGLTIVHTDPNRLGILVSASVTQIQRSFQVNFAKVSASSGSFVSAITPPAVPTSIAPLLVGINGLQPHIRPHKFSRLLERPANGAGQELTPLISNSPPYLVSEIRKAYNADSLSLTGAGEKIAIVIDTFPLTSDLIAFWATNGVNQSLSNMEFVQVVSGILPAPSGEETLDVEWSSAIAAGARIRVYATQDLSFVNLDQAFEAILDDLPAQPTMHEVSISLGAGESSLPESQLIADAQYFAAMAAGGLSVFVSSGDTGSEEDGVTQVNYFASDPNVTAVGGTSLILSTCSGLTRSETAWSGSGGGMSGFFTRPVWQTGATLPAGSMRLVPDVASVADPETGALLILNGNEFQIGGTSWSAPVWSGFCALFNQARTSAHLASLGLLGPSVYPLLGTTGFRDITTGNNGDFSATAGYDLCTGVGAPSVATLVQPFTGGPIPPLAAPGGTPGPGGEIQSPDPECPLPSSSVTFTWSPGNATAFWLTVGKTPGGTEIFSSGQTGGTSFTVSNIPTDGRSIYVRLWSLVGGVWFLPPEEEVYTTFPANVLTPVIAPGSGKYKKRVTVSMACPTPQAIIRYSLDGSIPDVNSTVYTGPFVITTKGVTSVRAKAFLTGVPDSPPTSVTYTIK